MKHIIAIIALILSSPIVLAGDFDPYGIITTRPIPTPIPLGQIYTSPRISEITGAYTLYPDPLPRSTGNVGSRGGYLVDAIGNITPIVIVNPVRW